MCSLLRDCDTSDIYEHPAGKGQAIYFLFARSVNKHVLKAAAHNTIDCLLHTVFMFMYEGTMRAHVWEEKTSCITV